jgi:hypothetical protein
MRGPIREAVAHAADYFSEVARPSPRTGDNRPPKLADGYELEQLLIDRLKRLLDKAEPTHPILGAWAAASSKPDAEIGPAVAAMMATWGKIPEPRDPKVVNPIVFQELVSTQPKTLHQLVEMYARLVARVAPEAAGGPAAGPKEPAELAALRTLVGVEGSPLVVPRAEAMRVATGAEQRELRKLRKDDHHAHGRISGRSAAGDGAPRQADQPVDSHVFLRGNPGRPGEKVERRLPKLLGGAAVARDSSGRLDLARAIVSPDQSALRPDDRQLGMDPSLRPWAHRHSRRPRASW